MGTSQFLRSAELLRLWWPLISLEQYAPEISKLATSTRWSRAPIINLYDKKQQWRPHDHQPGDMGRPNNAMTCGWSISPWADPNMHFPCSAVTFSIKSFAKAKRQRVWSRLSHVLKSAHGMGNCNESSQIVERHLERNPSLIGRFLPPDVWLLQSYTFPEKFLKQLIFDLIHETSSQCRNATASQYRRWRAAEETHII